MAVEVVWLAQEYGSKIQNRIDEWLKSKNTSHSFVHSILYSFNNHLLGNKYVPEIMSDTI